MLKEKLKIIKIDPKYIEYLRKFDSKVQFNKLELNKQNKPFVGVLFSINDRKYYVPISSANKKTKLNKMYKKYYKKGREPIDIIFITDKNKKLLSALNLNNMIPVANNSLINYDITKDKDAGLLIKEYKYCMKNKEEIRRRAIKIYNMINLHTNKNLEKRCCNFKLLEEKCKEYEKLLLMKK